MRLRDKDALVTAAGSGIGRATAIRFAREGARVVCGDISAKSTKQTAESFRRGCGEALAVQVAVACRDQVDILRRRALDTYGRIHILVSCTGISVTRDFLDLPEDEWDRALAVSPNTTTVVGPDVGTVCRR